MQQDLLCLCACIKGFLLIPYSRHIFCLVWISFVIVDYCFLVIASMLDEWVYKIFWSWPWYITIQFLYLAIIIFFLLHKILYTKKCFNVASNSVFLYIKICTLYWFKNITFNDNWMNKGRTPCFFKFQIPNKTNPKMHFISLTKLFPGFAYFVEKQRR